MSQSENDNHPAAGRIGLYGGSFNPPHMAHALVLAWALGSGEVDEVWVIPTGGHPFGKPLAPWADRAAMCRIAFACFGACARVLDIERGPQTHYSIDTARELARRHPAASWRWVMGSDTLADAPQWRAWDELMALAPPLVIPREGALPAAQGAAAPPFALPAISSTFIRDCAARRRAEAMAPFLHRGVFGYIQQRGLYREELTHPGPVL